MSTIDTKGGAPAPAGAATSATAPAAAATAAPAPAALTRSKENEEKDHKATLGLILEGLEQSDVLFFGLIAAAKDMCVSPSQATADRFKILRSSCDVQRLLTMKITARALEMDTSKIDKELLLLAEFLQTKCSKPQ